MEVLKDISALWSLIHTLIMFMIIFKPRYSEKKTTLLTLSTMLPLMAANFILFVFLDYSNLGTLMLLTLSLPSCIFFWIISKYRDGRFFFTFCMVDTIVLEILYITNIVNHYLTPTTYLVVFIVRMLIFPVIEYWMYKKLRPMYLSVQEKGSRGWGFFAVIGILFYLVITLLMTYPTTITERPDQLPALILLFFLMPVIYIHIIVTLRKQQVFFEMTEQEHIMKLQVANISERVEEYSAANDAFRKERHDFRHKLKAIASLVEAKKYDELARIVEEYTDNIEKTKIIQYTKHAVIDSVLSVYIRKAEHYGINVKIGFDFPDSFVCNETELATALANAIENAIIACEKLPEEDRFIEIKVISRPTFMIMIRNSFDGQVLFDENGLPENPNGKVDGHGFGSRSIATFCAKYGGDYNFKASENIFTLFMYLK